MERAGCFLSASDALKAEAGGHARQLDVSVAVCGVYEAVSNGEFPGLCRQAFSFGARCFLGQAGRASATAAVPAATRPQREQLVRVRAIGGSVLRSKLGGSVTIAGCRGRANASAAWPPRRRLCSARAAEGACRHCALSIRSSAALTPWRLPRRSPLRL